MTQVPEWLTDPELQPSWMRIGARLERGGLLPEGYVVLTPTTPPQRRAVAALLGRASVPARVRVDLALLDIRLRERTNLGGLVEVLPIVTGNALLDRPARRARELDAREAPLVLARDLVPRPWTEDWVAGLRRTGVLTGRSDAEQVVRAAAVVLDEVAPAVPDGGHPSAWPDDPGAVPRHVTSRVELAARLLGDAHALDRGGVLHHVVLRALAAAGGVAVPATARGVEELWAGAGVAPDLLSRTCLVWGLRLTGTGALVGRLGDAADVGDPMHVTEWDLRRAGSLAPARGTRVLVCENPRVLEAVAQRGRDDRAVVCTSGEPNLVVDRVLLDLAAAQVDMYYHGDFDWPGLAMANRAMTRYAARPWRMSAAHYVAAVSGSGPPLQGPEVEPRWDRELGAAMRHHDRAVHEEVVLESLLAGLDHGSDAPGGP